MTDEFIIWQMKATFLMHFLWLTCHNPGWEKEPSRDLSGHKRTLESLDGVKSRRLILASHKSRRFADSSSVASPCFLGSSELKKRTLSHHHYRPGCCSERQHNLGPWLQEIAKNQTTKKQTEKRNKLARLPPLPRFCPTVMAIRSHDLQVATSFENHLYKTEKGSMLL